MAGYAQLLAEANQGRAPALSAHRVPDAAACQAFISARVCSSSRRESWRGRPRYTCTWHADELPCLPAPEPLQAGWSIAVTQARVHS